MKTVPPAVALACLALAAPARPQATADVIAATQLRVSAVDGTNERTIPAGSDLGQGANLTYSFNQGRCFDFAALDVAVRRPGADVVVTFTNRAEGTSIAAFCAAGGDVGAHAIRVRFHAAVPTAGRIVLEAFPVQNGSDTFSSWRSASSIDVGDDGSVELAGAEGAVGGTPLRLEVPVVLGPKGLAVRVDTRAFASVINVGTRTATANVSVAFRAGPAQFDTYGAPCGPSLEAVAFPEAGGVTAIRLCASGSAPSASAWMVFGLQELSLPIPGTGCPLRNDLLVASSVAIDGNGRGTLTLRFPAGFAARFLGQYLDAVPNGSGFFDFSTSNGLRIALP